jgi:hypothetical protein
MLGREAKNKNCLLWWVWVHLETTWTASSRTGALKAANSLQPIPLASHCAFCTFRCGLLFRVESFLFSSLVWSFVWTLILSIFFSCSLAECFSFYLFTYSLVDFLEYPCPIPTKCMSKLSTCHKSPSNFQGGFPVLVQF